MQMQGLSRNAIKLKMSSLSLADLRRQDLWPLRSKRKTLTGLRLPAIPTDVEFEKFVKKRKIWNTLPVESLNQAQTRFQRSCRCLINSQLCSYRPSYVLPSTSRRDIRRHLCKSRIFSLLRCSRNSVGVAPAAEVELLHLRNVVTCCRFTSCVLKPRPRPHCDPDPCH